MVLVILVRDHFMLVGICLKSAENPFSGSVWCWSKSRYLSQRSSQSWLVDAFEEKLSLLLRWSLRRAQSKQLTSTVARRCWRACLAWHCWRSWHWWPVWCIQLALSAARLGATVNREPRYTMSRFSTICMVSSESWKRLHSNLYAHDCTQFHFGNIDL